MAKAYVISAVRTAVGRAYRGSLKDTRPDDLGAAAIRAAVERSGVNPEDVEEVFGLARIRDNLGHRRGNVVLHHEGRGERLAGLDPSGVGGRPDDGNARPDKGVDGAFGHVSRRADHGQLDVVARELDELGVPSERLARGEIPHSGISRAGVNFQNRRGMGKRVNQSVLTRSGTQYENLHCTASTTGPLIAGAEWYYISVFESIPQRLLHLLSESRRTENSSPRRCKE